MTMYLERCDVCRSYRPVMTIREGKGVTRICYSCAVVLGRVRLGGSGSISMTKRGGEVIRKIAEELSMPNFAEP